MTKEKLFPFIVGLAVVLSVGAILYFVFISEGAKAGATYNQCRRNCVTPVPSVTVEPTAYPSIEPSITVEPTETPTATPSPTEVPGKPDVSDNRSDGRSDGLCSKPPCVDNRSGVPLYKETINK